MHGGLQNFEIEEKYFGIKNKYVAGSCFGVRFV